MALISYYFVVIEDKMELANKSEIRSKTLNRGNRSRVPVLANCFTCERIATADLSRTHHMSFSVLDNEISNLVEEHGAEVVFLQEVVRHQPGVVGHVVRQLHGRSFLVHVDGEDVVVLLRPEGDSSVRALVQSSSPQRSARRLTFPSYTTLLEVCWLEPPTTSPIFTQRPSLTLHWYASTFCPSLIKRVCPSRFPVIDLMLI